MQTMLSSKNYRAPFFLLFPYSSFSGSRYCWNRTFVSLKDESYTDPENPASVTSIVIIVAWTLVGQNSRGGTKNSSVRAGACWENMIHNRRRRSECITISCVSAVGCCFITPGETETDLLWREYFIHATNTGVLHQRLFWLQHWFGDTFRKEERKSRRNGEDAANDREDEWETPRNGIGETEQGSDVCGVLFFEVSTPQAITVALSNREGGRVDLGCIAEVGWRGAFECSEDQ